VPATAGSYIAGTVTNAAHDPIWGAYVEVDTTDDVFIGWTDTDVTGAYSIPGRSGQLLRIFRGTRGCLRRRLYSTSGLQYDESDASRSHRQRTSTANVTLPVVVHITGTVTHDGAALRHLVYASSAGYSSGKTTDAAGKYSNRS